ncbi:hypothetical protein [Chryseobacterium sp. YIM B08800]|uniref:hypothetical protein n=1 Tax=Chryseobacterium sp. YIM B08800 TaxID=2984136 RepID=UPI00223EB711|nr:hypothetical protein [Chryseobacterium sp. YIM B08800]
MSRRPINIGGKESVIIIRIQKSRKENWKKLCSKKHISLTSLIIDSVESRILDNESRKTLAFIKNRIIFLERLNSF